MPGDRELRFASEDIELFSRGAGDRNPLHVDPAFAARTAFGGCAVPGALSTIAMLAALPEPALREIARVRLSFAAPLIADETATVTATQPGGADGGWELTLDGRGRALVRALALRLDAERPRSDSAVCAPVIRDALPMRTEPADRELASLAGGPPIVGTYAARPELGQVAERWGASALAPALLEGLAWASYVVGMELPGRRALFAALDLRAGDSRLPGVTHSLALRDYDERTGLLVIDAVLLDRAGRRRCEARIEAFALPEPPAPDPARLAPAGVRAGGDGAVVVIGGSRGFGASLALALLGGGHEVYATYHASPDSAAALAESGGAALHTVRTDARRPESVGELARLIHESASNSRPLTGLVLAAAISPLPMGVTASSSVALTAYVADSLRLVVVPLGGLLELIDPDRGWVLFCSSAALSAPPRDWPHYVAAKAAIEGLAAWVARTAPTLRSVVLRAPKMLTAMTATPSGRIGAVRADDVAIWTAGRLADGLAPGLTVLEPSADDVRGQP